jgi:hypothetical protein
MMQVYWILGFKPSLNTQSCIKGLLVVRDFYFWAIWAARPLHKKKLGADYEQLLRPFFSCFFGVLKKHSVRTKTLHNKLKRKYFFFKFCFE